MCCWDSRLKKKKKSQGFGEAKKMTEKKLAMSCKIL